MTQDSFNKPPTQSLTNKSLSRLGIWSHPIPVFWVVVVVVCPVDMITHQPADAWRTKVLQSISHILTTEDDTWDEEVRKRAEEQRQPLRLYSSHFSHCWIANPLNLQRARHLTPINHNTPSSLHTCPAVWLLWFTRKGLEKRSLQLRSIAFQWPAAAEVAFDPILSVCVCLRGFRSLPVCHLMRIITP